MSIVCHESFNSLYADPACGPFGSGTLAEQGAAIATVLYDHRASNRPRSTPALLTVIEDTFGRPVVPGAMIMFEKRAGSATGQLQVLHGFWKYKSSIMNPSPFDGKTYAYVGDVQGTVIRSVEFDCSQLELTDTVTVAADTTYQNQLYVDNPSLDLLPAHPPGAPNTRTIRTRKAMYLPFPLVEPIIGCQGLTARQVYHALQPLIASKNWTACCSKVLDFLMIAGTTPYGATEPANLVDSIEGGVVPTEVMFHMQKEVLHRYLPQLNPINISSSGANDRLASVLEDFSTMQATDMQQKADARAAKLAPTDIPTRFGPVVTDRILKTTHVVCWSDAPEIYGELAGRKKGQ